MASKWHADGDPLVHPELSVSKAADKMNLLAAKLQNYCQELFHKSEV
jgi:hypothetical protein